MGLLKAGAGALGGVLADSWRDYFYCDALNADTLVVKGMKRTSDKGRSSNTKGESTSSPTARSSPWPTAST